MLMVRTVPHLTSALHLTSDQIGAIAFSVTAATGIALYVYYNRKPSPEEVERLRRLFLAEKGRITDATLVDTRLHEPPEAAAEAEGPPSVLQYQYRVGGVGYESVQDVSRLPEKVQNIRVDLPIQIRYDPHNPGNSIVVAESWSGLRVNVERRKKPRI
jgi:hypothetical protein